MHWFVTTLLAILLTGCADAPSTLEPRGPAAARIADLWWVLLGLGTLVFVVVMGFLLFALLRRTQPDAASAVRSGTRMIVLAGIIVPAVILLVVFGLTAGVLRALATPTAETLTIHVVGHQWWWEVYYPQQQVETANEIHIPAGQPVQITLTSQDVIHSFWVPELHGKLDLIPNRTNTFRLQADTPGVYWGECAEFCGIQHAKMAFVVVAEPAEQFAAWLEQQQQPAAVPSDSLAQQGQQLFLSLTCIQCHTIQGTQATGDLGPDLTHLASRRTLGAGSIPNNPGNLGGWISNSQHIKPGNLMPASNLTGTELQALLAYLGTLE